MKFLKNKKFLLITSLLLIIIVLLYIEMAVGILGSPLAGN